MNTKKVPLIAERHLGARYFIDSPKIKCCSFIFMMYHEAGLSTDFSLQPVITTPDQLVEENNIGKIIFLLRKTLEGYLFSHLAIVYDDQSVIHYSRHCAPNKLRRVLINSFSELLEVYDLVPNPYISK